MSPATAKERLFEGLLESAPDAIVIVDERGVIAIVNGRVEELFGYAREELIGQPVEMLVPEALHEAHVAHRSEYAGDPRTRPMGAELDLTARRKDGSEVPVEISLSPLRTEDGTLVTAIVRDISERKRLDAERAEARLRREVFRHTIEAQEEERRRIARDLHDETGQALTGAILHLGRIEQATELETARRECGEVRAQLAQTVDELRRLATRLRPSVLDDLGLVPALEHLVDEAGRHGGERIELSTERIDGRPDPDVETVVYRVVQEALTNALRHADATRIEVSLRSDRDTLIAVVSDDGQGLEVNAATERGLGMAGMHERAASCDGTLLVESEPQRGTAVTLTLPARGAGA